MNKLLEVKDLVTNFYTYEGVVKAINHVSLDIEKDIIFGLVGESGCGKSVTARSILQIIQPPGVIEGGEILFYNDKDDGKKNVDLLKQDDQFMQKLRGSLISMIFQEPNLALNPVLSIGYQIAESFHFHQKTEMSQTILDELKSSDCKMFQPLRGFYSRWLPRLLSFVQPGWLIWTVCRCRRFARQIQWILTAKALQLSGWI